MNFKDLRVSKPLLNALEDLDYVYPTPIQQKSFRRISSGIDLIGIAKTGTGKTLAYLLPILSQLEYSTQKQPRILIVVPTRELVTQVCEEAEKIAKYKSLRIKGVFGGANINTQKDYVFDQGADILVGTPGRLYDIAVTGIIRFSNIKKIVIDEVDEMLSLGFRPQLEQIFEMLPKKRQHLMFSSTLSEDVEEFIKSYFNSPEKIEVDLESTPVEKIKQIFFPVQNFSTKIEFLKVLISPKDEFVKNLIFVADKKQADLVFDKLSAEYDDIGIIHSNKSQNYRFNTIKNFEKKKIRSLIATDIVARGLDFSDISHVINFSVPEKASDYIHRIGRTARAGKTGVSILMYSPYEEKSFEEIKQIAGENIIEENIPKTIPEIKTLLEFEKPSFTHKQITKAPDITKGGGAYHEKRNIKTKQKTKRRR
ncbi:MAG: DEAD/DEAH box helicase [Bacteroidales bacterium]|jgi:ATP-dependent RNA helicase RhlE|nr:DEAD/DEAH box helicase [Bacteroidales bacterium]MCK9498544.1 DEAD/DEAH box helicase [Bacteroidales bacterium]MDY0314329.1 DEAD/DEAH box helicase [Bacteroidales bacterium]NLB86980.1 DEAD/DEAH box helicase [Bacteroidales bacterium]NLB87007.1 DEAD/DEAH box helicase [Bacteroidales bacterium]